MLLTINYFAIFVAGLFAILALYAEHRNSGAPGFSLLGIAAVVGVVLSSVIAAMSLTMTHQSEQRAAKLRIEEMEKVFTGQARLHEAQIASLAKQAEIQGNQSVALKTQVEVLRKVIRTSQPFEFDRFLILFDVKEMTEASSELNQDALNLGVNAHFCTTQEADSILKTDSSLNDLNSRCSGRVMGRYNNDLSFGSAKGRDYWNGLELEIPPNGVIVDSVRKNSVFHFQDGMVFLEIYVIKTEGSRYPLAKSFFEQFDWAFELYSGSIVYRFDSESIEVARISTGSEPSIDASVLRVDFDPEQSLR